MFRFLRKKLHSLYQSLYQIIFGRPELVIGVPLTFSNVPDLSINIDLDKALEETSSSFKKINEQLKSRRELERESLIKSLNSHPPLTTSHPFNCILIASKIDYPKCSFMMNKPLGFAVEQPGEHGFLMR